MNNTLWTPSTSASSASILDGDAMEEVMRRSLEDNTYSVQGFWLWQARAIQQRRHREQGRRRPRSDAASLVSEITPSSTAVEPRNSAEEAAQHHAEEVRSYITALLHATGYPYAATPDSADAAKEAQETNNTVLTGVAAAGGVLDAAVSAPNPPSSSSFGFNSQDSGSAESALISGGASAAAAPPLKAARVEQASTLTTSPTTASAAPASAPKSALAKLVAKAKAQHRDGAGTTNVTRVTVVPASTSSAFPEEIPGGRLAQGSSALPGTATRKKKVHFADASADSDHDGFSASRVDEGKGSDGEDEEDFGVQLPGYTAASSPATAVASASATDEAATEEDATVATKHPSQMTRAEFLSQFKRAPRRGEIGQTAEDIAAAEKLGYVMSGSRSVASRMYVDRIQRQLHEHEATKLQQQFRKVEDERMDDHLVHGLAEFIMKKTDNAN